MSTAKEIKNNDKKNDKKQELHSCNSNILNPDDATGNKKPGPLEAGQHAVIFENVVAGG